MSRILVVVTALILFSASAFATGALDGLYAYDKTPAKTAHPLDVDDFTFWEQLRLEWGYLVTKATVKIFQEDFTCDGHPDYVAGRVNPNPVDGGVATFDLMVVTRDGGELIAETISTPFDGSQGGLCGLGEIHQQIDMKIETFEQEQVDKVFGAEGRVCSKAVRIEDDMCDALRYFWVKGEIAEDEERFLLYDRK